MWQASLDNVPQIEAEPIKFKLVNKFYNFIKRLHMIYEESILTPLKDWKFQGLTNIHHFQCIGNKSLFFKLSWFKHAYSLDWMFWRY